MKNLLPVCDIRLIPSLDIRYMPGNPRSYRLDLGKGILNIEGKEQITQPGESFKVIPIAFRCLEDGLFGQAKKKWCEVYFINQEGHLCVFMFHGFSVQNLSEAARDLYYQKRGLCEALWTVKLEKKTNKQGQSYYMAFFDFKPLSAKELERHHHFINEITTTFHHLYRADTLDAKTLFSENYSTHLDTTKGELEAEQIQDSSPSPSTDKENKIAA